MTTVTEMSWSGQVRRNESQHSRKTLLCYSRIALEFADVKSVNHNILFVQKYIIMFFHASWKHTVYNRIHRHHKGSLCFKLLLTGKSAGTKLQ